MSVVESLQRLGGVASRAALIAVTDRGQVDRPLDAGVTTRGRTLNDCLRGLPFDEALAVADSALRHGFSHRLLKGLAGSARGPGSAQMRRVARLATPDADNPFESGLGSVAADVPGLDVTPQVSIYDPQFLGRPDLVDERLGVILEAAVAERADRTCMGCRAA